MFFFVIMGYPPLKWVAFQTAYESHHCKISLFTWWFLCDIEPFRIYVFVPLIVTMYTVLDPIAITFFIHEYRRAVLKMVKRPFLVGQTRNIAAFSTTHAQTIEVRSTNWCIITECIFLFNKQCLISLTSIISELTSSVGKFDYWWLRSSWRTENKNLDPEILLSKR